MDQANRVIVRSDDWILDLCMFLRSADCARSRGVRVVGSSMRLRIVVTIMIQKADTSAVHMTMPYSRPTVGLVCLCMACRKSNTNSTAIKYRGLVG